MNAEKIENPVNKNKLLSILIISGAIVLSGFVVYQQDVKVSSIFKQFCALYAPVDNSRTKVSMSFGEEFKQNQDSASSLHHGNYLR